MKNKKQSEAEVLLRAVEMPGREFLNALPTEYSEKAGPRIFRDGEAAWRKHLEAQGLTESEGDYVSRTGRDKRPAAHDPNAEHYKFNWEE